MHKTLQLVIIAGIALALFSTSSLIPNASASPYYTKKTKYMIFLTIKPVDPTGKSNNCWNEIYARATAKNANHVLLNKETIVNNHPNNGPSKTYFLKWYYNINTFHQSDAVNENKIRTYAFLELKIGNSPTVTKYLDISKSKTMTVNGVTVRVLDFTTYYLVTDPSQCPRI